MVDYKLLTEMLEAALAKETSESWNRFLDDCYADSHLIDAVATLDVSAFHVNEPMIWSQENVVVKNVAEKDVEKNRDNPYAIAA